MDILQSFLLPAKSSFLSQSTNLNNARICPNYLDLYFPQRKLLWEKRFGTPKTPLVKHDKKHFENVNCLLFPHETVYLVREAKIRNFAPDISACPNVLPRTKQMLLHELM
jgi:hypothetical protein